MKAKKYTNSSWTEGDYAKEYSTATDTYTTLPAEFQTSGADVENYEVFGETVENLWDIDTWNGVTAQRGTIERIGNSFKLTATENDAYSKTYANSDYAYEVTPNEQYTLSWNIDNPEIYGTIFVFTGENDGSTILVTVVSSVKSITFTIPNNHHFLSFRIGVSYPGTSITYSNIMLTKGSTVPTRYVPYGTPDGVGEETENLFNISEYAIGGTTFPGKMLTLEPNTAYTMSSDAPTYNNGALIVLMAVGESATTANNGVYNGHPITKTTDANGNIYVGLRDNGSGYDLSTYKTMLVKGSTAPTTFIPYGYKIPILLNITKTGYSAASGTIEQGRYSTDQGSEITAIADTARIRLSSYVSVSYNDTLVIDASIRTNISCSIIFTDVNNVVVGSSAWVSLPYTRTINYENVKKCYVVFRKADDSAISPSDVGTVSVTYKPVNSSNYDLFIGDSKLGAEEYVDYATQKLYKLKEVHKDTVTIDGVVWDILGYDHDEVYDGEGNLAQHSVTIQTHDCIAGLQFDTREALFAFPNGLTAGTYHFTVSQSLYSGDVGKAMQFTLQNDILTDGIIVLGNAYNATMVNSTLSVYASTTSTTASETATIIEGNGGTDLGSVSNAISGNTNSIQRALVGNNNYHQSAIRQYLNSDGAAGSYWTPQNKWDRSPSWNASQAGFLNGYSANFKSAIGTSKKVTALNNITDGGGTEITNEKVFLLSKTEAYCGGSEGTAYSYYSDYSSLSGAGGDADSNRIKTFNGTAAYWYLRSPYAERAQYESDISNAGAGHTSMAMNANGISPAVCIPLDNINNDPYLQSLFLKPTDPPLPFPTLTTYLGENSIDVDTTVQPEKVVLTVAAWREKEGKEYNGGSWS